MVELNYKMQRLIDVYDKSTWHSSATVSIQLCSPTKVHNTTSRNLSDFDSVKFEPIVRSSVLFTAPSTDVDGFTDQLIDQVMFTLNAVCPLISRRPQPLSPDAVFANHKRRRLERHWLQSGMDKDLMAHRLHCRLTNRIITDLQVKLHLFLLHHHHLTLLVTIQLYKSSSQSLHLKSSNSIFHLLKDICSVLKLCPSLFSDLIAHLSFSKGVFQSKLKHASVSPILKKPNLDPSELANYRPISKLNNISKILERLFLTSLQPHIISSPNFNPLQSAYRRHHWIETFLVHLLDSVNHAADDGLATLLLPLISVQPSIPSIILISSASF